MGLRRVSLGTLINPGTVITTLDDISAIKVDFAVPESYVSQLRAGQAVVARTNAGPVAISSARWPASIRASIPPRVQ